MTVCIAALCGGGEAIVVSSDRMITAGPPMNLEFEHDVKKIDVLGGRFVTMSSGDALIGTTINDSVSESLAKAPTADIWATAEFLKKSYTDTRTRVVEDQNLRPINYSFATFQSEGQKQIPPQIYGQILQGIGTFTVTLNLL